MKNEQRKQFIQSLPLADLHRHFDGSIRPETLWELSETYYSAVPGLDYEQFRHYLQWDDNLDNSLLDYLDKFHVPLQYTQFYDNIRRISYELAEDAYNDGIRLLEATRKGFSTFGKKHPDFKVGIIVIAMRNHGGNMARILLREVLGEREDFHNGVGVIGFDIAGHEAPFPPVLFRDAYDLATKMGLKKTAHAGESEGPERIWEALDYLGPDRIGHGTSAGDDPQLIKRLADDGVMLEVCLSSNLQTGAIEKLENHPLPRFLDAGVKVALCTDNPTVSNTSLSREYELAMDTFGLSENDALELARMSCSGTFLAEGCHCKFPEKA